MPDKGSEYFYISLRSKDDSVVGYTVSSEPPALGKEAAPLLTEKPATADPSPQSAAPLNFKEVFQTFISAMESYRRFITLTLAISPRLSSAMASDRIQTFVKAKGIAKPELSNETTTVYQLARTCYREYRLHQDEIKAIMGGARHLPEVATIGLVSTYDAFLGRLLHVVLNIHPEIVLTSEKTIKFSDLSKFASIEEARSSLIGREIDAVIRSSHQDQFAWMEERFSIPLRKNLATWPRFVELCERRNLITHTGGVVSPQYIANCQAHKVDLSEVKVGTRLVVDGKYFSDAVSIIYEIGAKLCHVLWRKFAAAERQDADHALNELCFDLITAPAYRLAEALLTFGTTVLKEHSNDRVRRMMIVNLANAVRLQGRKGDAKKILEDEDWTAVDNEFAICVAAVREDVAEVARLMPIIGAKGNLTAESYRTWPVFRGMGSEPRFTSVFEEVFGEPFIGSSATEIDQPESANADAGASKDAPTRRLLN